MLYSSQPAGAKKWEVRIYAHVTSGLEHPALVARLFSCCGHHPRPAEVQAVGLAVRSALRCRLAEAFFCPMSSVRQLACSWQFMQLRTASGVHDTGSITLLSQ
jgi:hypothetical protein